MGIFFSCRPRKMQSHSPSTLSPHTPTSSSSYFPSPSHSHQIHSSHLTASYTHHTPSSASSSPSPLTPSTYSHHHTPHQPLPSSPYQGGSGPVQSTVIVQQQSGQSLCVQQQVGPVSCDTHVTSVLILCHMTDVCSMSSDYYHCNLYCCHVILM